jgi:predicted RNA-binding protein (virulence factor B family)
MYIILKLIKNNKGKEIPVILLDSQGEVMEFEDHSEAERIRALFEKNSDSGYKYLLRTIGNVN